MNTHLQCQQRRTLSGGLFADIPVMLRSVSTKLTVFSIYVKNDKESIRENNHQHHHQKGDTVRSLTKYFKAITWNRVHQGGKGFLIN